MKLSIENRSKVEKLIEDRVVQGEKRGYLGLSQIGKECPRSLFFDFRFCSKNEFTPRQARLFERGHREEPVIVADLEKIGVNVFSSSECRELGYPIVKMENGEEQIEVVAGHGHIRGHGDGLGVNLPDDPKTIHYLEFKTVKEGKDTKKNKYNFYKLCDVGLKKYDTTYWIQCQTMMLLLGVTRTQFIAVNKNNDARYYERIRLNKIEATDAIRRGEKIIFSETPPPAASSWKCTWCNHESICKTGAFPEKNCRTCQYCDMEDDGKWSCSKKGREIDLNEQIWEIGECSRHELLNTLG